MSVDMTVALLPPGLDWKPDPHEASMTYRGAFWRKPCGEGSRVEMIAADHYLNTDGRVARGIILAFADHVVGCAGIARFGVAQVTIALEVPFADSAGPGELIEVRGELRGATADGNIVYLACRIHANGRFVATSQGLWKHVRPL